MTACDKALPVALDFCIFEVQIVLWQLFVPRDASVMWLRKAFWLTFLTSLAAASPVACAQSAVAEQPGASVSSTPAKRADLRTASLSRDLQHIAQWAVHSGDHKRLPFIVVDKINAVAAAFDASGRLIRTTPVLIGMGVGDTYAPGVANMDMYQTQPWQRITPAGRYFAEEDRNLDGERVLWVDYDSGIAMHKMPAKRTKQHRQERMVSPDPAEHRITYGCINVPAAFYDQVVHPNFRRKGGIVYVLPDSRSVKSVFNSYDIENAASPAPVRQSANDALPLATRKF
jgi:hypothetical protein